MTRFQTALRDPKLHMHDLIAISCKISPFYTPALGSNLPHCLHRNGIAKGFLRASAIYWVDASNAAQILEAHTFLSAQFSENLARAEEYDVGIDILSSRKIQGPHPFGFNSRRARILGNFEGFALYLPTFLPVKIEYLVDVSCRSNSIRVEIKLLLPK